MRNALLAGALVLAMSLFLPAATTKPTSDDEFLKNYSEAIESARTQFTDQINQSKKAREEQLTDAQKKLKESTAGSTDSYAAAAQKALGAYAEARKLAIAATAAGYDAMITKATKADQRDQAAALKDARKKFLASSQDDEEQARASAEALAGVDEKADREAVERGPIVADHILAVVDDFIIDIYHNGKKIPDADRVMEDEIYGATIERIKIDVRQGDWIVFNVANNRLRWGGVNCFIAAGFKEEKPAFVTDPAGGQWSYCDELRDVEKFIAERAYLADQTARQSDNAWGDGVTRFNQKVPDSGGVPIWGNSRCTWIKFVAKTSRN